MAVACAFFHRKREPASSSLLSIRVATSARDETGTRSKCPARVAGIKKGCWVELSQKTLIKKKNCNLRSSVTALRIASLTRTRRSSTTSVSCNTHRSGLSPTPQPWQGLQRLHTQFTRQHPLQQGTVLFRWELSVDGHGVPPQLGHPDTFTLIFISPTRTRLGTASRSFPVIQNTILPWAISSTSYKSASSSPTRRKIHQGREIDRDNENDHKKPPHSCK